MQVFIGRGADSPTEDEFERRLYIAAQGRSPTRSTRNKERARRLLPVSLSCRTIVYKGMFLAYQLGAYYPTCTTRASRVALALVHQRFSTNTFPSWRWRIPTGWSPQRRDQHAARQRQLDGGAAGLGRFSPLFGDDISKLWPISYEGQSDTACFDNALEFLVQGGYSLAHAMMMLIPEAWAGNPLMDEERRAFYEYHAALMEPWDGPAASPSPTAARSARRSTATACARRAISSPTTTASSWRRKPACCRSRREDRQKWRLQPGKMLLIDLEQGRIISDEEIKASSPTATPTRSGSSAPRSCWRTCRPSSRARAHRRVAARSPAGLRLHAGRPQAPDGADGVTGQEASARWARHADLGAVRQVEAALHLFQAELRAGHQPADRSDPRGAGDEPRVVHRAAAEHLDLEGTSRASGSRCASRSSPTRTSRRSAASATSRQRVRHQDARHHLSRREGRRRHGGGARALCERAERPCAAATTSSSCRTAWSGRTASRSRRCSRPRRAPSPDPQGPAHLGRPRRRTGEPREVHHFCCLAGYGAEAINPYLAFETLLA
jgi:glutamate synthase (NADPH) large chain